MRSDIVIGMVKNLTTNEIFLFIVGDFRGAWDSIAANHQIIGRGNFMFAVQAMNLLEFAGRLCKSDTSGKMLLSFSNELNKIESRYFAAMPFNMPYPIEFDLPVQSNNKNNLLIMLFDLIRNGVSHQYQQIIISLQNGKNFCVSLSGADIGKSINLVKQSGSSIHLSHSIDSDGDLTLNIDPGILFLDFEAAIIKSEILNIGSIQYLVRPRKKTEYHVDLLTLESNLP